MTAPDALPAAVLWDMDGTLVDTEPYWIAAEHEIVAEHGGRWSDELAHQLVGNPLLVSARFIIANSPLECTPEELVDELLLRVVRQGPRHTPWRPGARGLVTAPGELGGPGALVPMSWQSLAGGRAALKADEDRAGRGELEALLSGEADGNDAYLEVNSGAGGTESNDWANMLLRMYSRSAQAHGMTEEFIEETAGEQAGVKPVTPDGKGPNAYGWMRTQAGAPRPGAGTPLRDPPPVTTAASATRSGSRTA